MSSFKIGDMVILHRPNNPKTVPRWIEDWDDLDGEEFRVVELAYNHEWVFLNREDDWRVYVFPPEWLELVSRSEPVGDLEPDISSFLGGV